MYRIVTPGCAGICAGGILPAMDKLDTTSLVRMALDHIDQGITVFDADLKLVAWNRQFLRLLRFPESLAFEGAEFESFIRHNAQKGEYGPGDEDAQVQERVSVARLFQPHSMERTAPDGRVLKVVGSPLPAGGFVTVYTDITAEKSRAEDLERRVAERTLQLRQSEARLNLIADEVPAGIAHVDQEMRVLYANRRFARAYGHSPLSIVGLACHDVLHPDTLSTSEVFFEQARRGAIVDFEMRITLPDGRTKDVRTFLRPERPSEGNAIGFYILSVDVTKQKAANEALLQSRKMDALGRLSSGISHDFNNLLTIVLGNLVPLRDKVQDDGQRAEYLDPAIAAARRGSELTKRLLTLARTRPLDPKPVDLGRALADLVKLLQASMPRAVTIEYHQHHDLPACLVDKAQLEMALLNLALNARDAISGEGRISITLDPLELSPSEAARNRLVSGPYLRIRVSDDGIGISPQNREQVFEPFYTSKTEGGGTGLGLAMVFGFAQQSNGAISVDSELGLGTTFTLLLPAQPGSVTAPEAAEVATGIPTFDQPHLVLLVEDEGEVRKVVRRQLQSLGLAVLEAEDAEAALSLIEAVSGIALVLSDVSMPGAMDGIGLARAVRATHPDLPVVLMSGQLVWADTATAELGCPFVAKPLNDRDLAVACSRAMAQPARPHPESD